MKATYTTATGRITFEVEGENAKALFRELASVQEVFDAEQCCGVCQGTAIRLLARKVDDFDFYELACANPECRARFEYGQSKKGGNLFPKRKDDDGRWLPNRGWTRYVPPTADAVRPPEETKYEPEHKPAPRPALAGKPPEPDTPEGLQPSFDRMGVLFAKPAPTRLGPALDMIRDQMQRAAGFVGTGEFDRLYRRYETGPGKNETPTVKALLRDLMQALERLKQEVHQ